MNHFLYDSYGKLISQTGTTPRYGFAGRELDTESGLYFNRARYYDPLVGRFISEDPSEFAGGDANLYRYVGNSPTNAVDPSGLEAQSAFHNYMLNNMFSNAISSASSSGQSSSFPSSSTSDPISYSSSLITRAAVPSPLARRSKIVSGM